MNSIKPKSERLRRILTLWNTRRGDRILPERADLPPTDFDPKDLPYLVLLDVSNEGQDFAYRLVGTGVVGFVGQEITGLSVSAYQRRHEEPEMVEAYAVAAKQNRPTLYDGTLKRFDKEFVVYERLALPLQGRHRDGETHQILAAFDFQYAKAHLTGSKTSVWPHGPQRLPAVNFT
ncbi:PAS domain-containing protein [Hwanghaeella grinnelliae]|uniref:PAS domain-containing protein n=1 Tax=Hwanghaeella grinnelliae TaxID=2500179 RepID=A0A437QJZ0_9PROT|nr:PAS domain-containing protein [Hwanghaeella grinnelliae]RVU34818.1 PAS domain-containing protein [Hwanghaeella grinnelliae]